jgi:hypothetical protein
MMENKQTAIDWLVKQVKLGDKSFDEFFRGEIEQAKQMEKEQMEEFYNEGQDFSTYVTDEIYGGVEYWEREPMDFEQYYKENYGK